MDGRLAANFGWQLPFVWQELTMMLFCTVWSGRNRVLRPCSELAAGVILGVAEGHATRHTRCELEVGRRQIPR